MLFGVIVVLLFGLANSCINELADIAILPNDPFFQEKSLMKNNLYNNKKTAFIALPKSAEDIQRSLKCANEQGMKVSIKNGGHSAGGYSTIPSPGFMINLEEMNKVKWNKDNTITVEGGAKWQDVYNLLEKHKNYWVVSPALCPSVGVVGYTLGGGFGFNSRKHGMAIDSVISFKMITADGEDIVNANSEINSDLFWALRGGGGSNFGVVIELTFKTHLKTKLQTWGSICYKNSSKVSSIALDNLGKAELNFPKKLSVNAVIRPNKELCLWVIYLGSKHKAIEHLYPILKNKIVKPYAVKFSEYSVWRNMLDELSKAHKKHKLVKGKNIPFLMKTSFLEELTPEISKAITNFSMPSFCSQHLMHLGGNIHHKPAESTAFYWRNAHYMIYTDCLFKSNNEKKIAQDFLSDWWEIMSIHTQGSYVNFADPQLKGWKDLYYGDNLDRLLEIKKEWNSAEENSPLRFEQEIDS